MIVAAPTPGRPWRAPLPGESFDGYLAYRAAHALMPGPFTITALGGAFHANYPQLAFGGPHLGDGLQEVADALGIAVEELRARSHAEVESGRRRFQSTVLSGKLIEKLSRRFSPASLAASPHHRAIWSVRCLPFCEESWETLTDACPASYCGTVQRWRRSSGLDRCDRCGNSLLSAVVRSVPERDQAPLRMLCGLLHHDPARVAESLALLPKALRGMRSGGLVEIASAIAGLHDPDLRCWSIRRIRSDAEPLRVASAMAEAGRLLLEWPRSGERLAASRLATRPGKFGDGNMGATLDFVALAGDGRATDPVEHAAGMLAAALRGNGATGRPIKQSILGTGLTVSRMADLRRSGGVDTVFHLAGTRIIPLIASASIDRLRERRGDGLPIRIVARRLGVGCNGVEQMLLSGALLPAGRSDGPPFHARTKIDTGSLERLLLRLADVAKCRPDPSWVSMAEASHRMGGDLKPWGAWFDRILDGSIATALHANGGTVSSDIRVSLRTADIMRAARIDFESSGPAFHPLMSKRDAIATLNIHNRYARIAFQDWPSREDHFPVVPICDVRRLAEHHVAAPELAALLGSTSLIVGRTARTLGLDLTCRGYVRAAALERFGLMPHHGSPRCSY